MEDVPPLPTEEEWRLLTALLGQATEQLFLLRADGTYAAGYAVGSVDPLGYPVGERADSHVAERVHPEDLPGVLAALERSSREPGLEQRVTGRIQHRDGRWLRFDATAVSHVDHPVLAGHVLRSRLFDDGAEQPAVGAPVAADDGRFVSLAEAVPLGILSADRKGFVVYANGAAQELLDLPLDALCGDGWQRVVVAADLGDVTAATAAAVATGSRTTASFRVRTGRGETWLQAAVVPMRAGAQVTGWLATLTDVTERRRHEAELAFCATHDELTGLPNRYLLRDRLDQALARLERDRSELAVLFVDLDDFKSVNDRHGHAAGDRVLTEVASRLRSVVRSNDTVARLGGDEFVAVCEAVDPGEADDIAERLGAELGRPVRWGGVRLPLGASIGVAATTDPGEPAGLLLDRADAAMYAVKAARRGRVA